jgi:hypothetical protein
MKCRLCRSLNLNTLLDLGVQHLGGQFPGSNDPDPPAFPLVLVRCSECGLVQLSETVPPELMFRTYGYRSGITKTMRDHLGAVGKTLGISKSPLSVLDIGCNDGTLLNNIKAECKVGIDPSNVESTGCERINGYFPQDMPESKFDLIFSIACFYDADDPVEFAKEVKKRLKHDGRWICEFASLNAMAQKTAFDSICHEHLCYYDLETFVKVLKSADMDWLSASHNDINGGSICVTCCPGPSTSVEPELLDEHSLMTFPERAQVAGLMLRGRLDYYRDARRSVHLLGASTKSNTVLQFCGITNKHIQFASDRDPAKVGRFTPGTRIPIISEEESRKLKPDVYVCLLHGFHDEIVEREREFIKSGGTLLFPLPKMEIVRS